MRALGYDPHDVRDVVVTHLDRDHAGGLGDFPWARVHVHAREHAAATSPAGARRYVADQWAHEPQWQLYADGGERWFDFDGVRPVDADASVLLVPLHGHTAGHAGVAVRRGEEWLLHAGDAYFHHRQVGNDGGCPPLLGMFQRRFDHDRRLRIATQATLRALNRSSAGVHMMCAHDAVELARMR